MMSENWRIPDLCERHVAWYRRFGKYPKQRPITDHIFLPATVADDSESTNSWGRELFPCDEKRIEVFSNSDGRHSFSMHDIDQQGTVRQSPLLLKQLRNNFLCVHYLAPVGIFDVT